MQAAGKGRLDMLQMEGVRRGHDHGVERPVQQFLDGRQRGHGKGLGDIGAGCRRRVADASEGKAVAEPQQIGDVLDLGDHARADHADAQNGHLSLSTAGRPPRPTRQ